MFILPCVYLFCLVSYEANAKRIEFVEQCFGSAGQVKIWQSVIYCFAFCILLVIISTIYVVLQKCALHKKS